MSHHVAVEIEQEGKKVFWPSPLKKQRSNVLKQCPQLNEEILYYNLDLNFYVPKYISLHKSSLTPNKV